MESSLTTNAVTLSEVEIKPLDPTMDRAAFYCGNKRIDNFFRNNARDQHSINRVRVYVAAYKSQPIGYYYLVAASNIPETVSAEAVKKFGRVNSTPCVYLGMIGVCEDYSGSGVGKTLMIHAMKKTLEVADLVGLYALTLDAVDEHIAKRYERWGFKRFIAGELAMYIPITTIRKALEISA